MPTRVHLDPGLFPLIRHTQTDAQYRVWLALRASDTRGAGWVDVQAISAVLAAYGVHYSDRHIRRILTAGAGQFWTRTVDRLWLTSEARLWQSLTLKVPEKVIQWTRPSKLKPAVDLSGQLDDFQARCYAAWIAGNTKRGRHGFKVSRDQICFLMNVSRPTLYTWEAKTGIEVTRADAQYAGNDASVIPDHANIYAAQVDDNEYETRARWRLPNTYTAHEYMGERRAARRATRRARNTAIENIKGSPVDNANGERLRRYFDSGDVDTTFAALRRVVRRGDVPGIPSVMQPPDVPRYAFIGYRNDGTEIWELPTQYEAAETSADERSAAAEKSPEFYRYWGMFKDAAAEGVIALSCLGHRFTGYKRSYVGVRVRGFIADLNAFVASVGGRFTITHTTDRPTAAAPRPTRTARPQINADAAIAVVYWQLDNALAAGRLALDTYRRLRDHMSDAPTEADRYSRAIGTQHHLRYAAAGGAP